MKNKAVVPHIDFNAQFENNCFKRFFKRSNCIFLQSLACYEEHTQCPAETHFSCTVYILSSYPDGEESTPSLTQHSLFPSFLPSFSLFTFFLFLSKCLKETCYCFLTFSLAATQKQTFSHQQMHKQACSFYFINQYIERG